MNNIIYLTKPEEFNSAIDKRILKVIKNTNSEANLKIMFETKHYIDIDNLLKSVNEIDLNLNQIMTSTSALKNCSHTSFKSLGPLMLRVHNLANETSIYINKFSLYSQENYKSYLNAYMFKFSINDGNLLCQSIKEVSQFLKEEFNKRYNIIKNKENEIALLQKKCACKK